MRSAAGRAASTTSSRRWPKASAAGSGCRGARSASCCATANPGSTRLASANFRRVGSSIAARASCSWHRSFNHLYRLHGRQPVLGAWPETFPEMMKAQRAVAGSPRTVIEFMRRQVEASGINYIVAQLMFGDLPHETTRRSIELYAREVIPSIRG